MNTESSCRRALCLPELLENVLLNMPVKQTLIVQAVCKEWRDCIHNSISLQQALFLRPITDEVVHLVSDEEIIPAKIWPPEMRVGHWEYANASQRIVKPLVNPLIQEFLLARFHEYLNGYFTFLHYGFIVKDLNLERQQAYDIDSAGPQSLECVARLHRRGASWRKMLVMQPPCREINVSACSRYLTVTNSEGVTFGDVLDVVRAHYQEEKHVSSFHCEQCWDVVGFTMKYGR